MARQDRHDEGHQGLNVAAVRAAPAWVTAGVIGVVLYDPTRRHAVTCPIHALTGLDCPGCGATRAVDLLARGHVLSALRSNVLAIAFGVWLVGWWAHAVWPATTPWLARWATPLRSRSPAVVRTLLVVVVAFTVVRNLPGPDRWLAPPST